MGVYPTKVEKIIDDGQMLQKEEISYDNARVNDEIRIEIDDNMVET